MLVHPWDQAIDDDEWLTWLRDGHDFGQVIAAGTDGWPTVVPAHFILDGDRRVLLHLARPNPLWKVIDANPRVVLSVLDDYAYVPTTWRAPAGTSARDGVPTSYYATVQLRCDAEIIDDPAEKADVLRRQLTHFQPAGDFSSVSTEEPPYSKLLPAIRALRLHIVEVTAKFKFDDQKSVEWRMLVADRLAQRHQDRDLGARDQQLRRLARTTE